MLHKDMIDRHSQSIMHKQAMECEPTRLSVKHHGGIQQPFQRQVCLQRRALVGALKTVYCLAKQEIALTTKYEPAGFKPFLRLLILKELEVGGNVRYRSHTIIGEFLKVLATIVKE